jgi:tetratricopeptide (TPR) repeat protein
MSEHETLEEWDGDPTKRLSSKEGVRHLLRGCGPCEAAARQSWSFMKAAAKGEPGVQEERSAYDDAALDRAAENARRAAALPPREQRRFLKATSLLRSGDGVLAIAGTGNMTVEGLGVYEALLARSWALRYENPREMWHLANVAVQMCDAFDPEVYGAKKVADLKARAWGELANAYRVADCLREAQKAFGEAFAFYDQGSGDRGLKMRLLDLEASLRGTLRQFPLALQALTMLAGMYRDRGADHLAGRALIKKALYTFYSGDAEQACQTITEGLALIDLDRDPSLSVTATLNQLLFHVECERFSEAKRLLFKNRVRLSSMDHVLKLRLRWIEGRISYGMSQLQSAELAFREAKEGFAAVDMGFACALAGLDLAMTLLRQGRREESIKEGQESAAMFHALGIYREILGAAKLLEEAFQAQTTDLALLEASAQYLRKTMIELGVG